MIEDSAMEREVKLMQVQTYSEQVIKLEKDLLQDGKLTRPPRQCPFIRKLNGFNEEEVVLSIFLIVSIVMHLYYSIKTATPQTLSIVYLVHTGFCLIGLTGIFIYPWALRTYRLYALTSFVCTTFTALGTAVFLFRRNICTDVRRVFGAEDSLYRLCSAEPMLFKLLSLFTMVAEIGMEVLVVICVQRIFLRMQKSSLKKPGTIFIP